MQNDANRRTFIKTSTAAAAGAALTSTIARTAHAAGSDEIKFVLIGCGGRGLGATENIMNTKGNVKLVAAADPFVEKAADNLERSRQKAKRKVQGQDRRAAGANLRWLGRLQEGDRCRLLIWS